MKVQVGAGGVVAAVGLVAAGVALWYGAGKLKAVAGAVGDAAVAAGQWTATNLNPAADTNLAYRGVNAAGAAIVSEPAGPGKNADGSWSLGGWLRDITSDDDERIAAMLQGGTYNSTRISDAALADARQIDRIIERQQADAFGGGATGSW